MIKLNNNFWIIPNNSTLKSHYICYTSTEISSKRYWKQPTTLWYMARFVGPSRSWSAREQCKIQKKQLEWHTVSLSWNLNVWAQVCWNWKYILPTCLDSKWNKVWIIKSKDMKNFSKLFSICIQSEMENHKKIKSYWWERGTWWIY
jgi:hypothetical protein